MQGTETAVEKFHVSIESPQSGWVAVGLNNARGEQVRLAASYQPNDAITELIEGLTGLLDSADSFTVRWNCEPHEYDFAFSPGDESPNDTALNVLYYPTHERRANEAETVFHAALSTRELCHIFYEELAELERRSDRDVYPSNWRRPFPHEDLSRLAEKING